MRLHIGELLGGKSEFDMLHAYLMRVRLIITNLVGWVQSGWLGVWVRGWV